MINLKKIKKEKCKPPTLLRRPAPAPYFHPFYNFPDSLLRGRLLKFTPPI